MPKFLASLCAFLCLQLSVRAWNAEGHMVVAQIAYNHLNPVAKAKCDALIAVPLRTYSSAATSNFVTAAVWADDFKGLLDTGNWHYINLPFSLDGTPTSGVATASFDVVQAINLSIATLQNPTITQSNQAVSLRYLLHFAGDIQQPLHCCTAVTASSPGGDAGGNGFSVNGLGNLHSLWDSGGGFLFDSLSRPLSATSKNTLNAKVASIEADYPYNYSTNLGTVPDPMNWAQEGLSLAQTICYVGITRGATPSTSYLNTAMATTEQRMARGGHRLADLLNTIFPLSPITLTSLTLTNGNFGFLWGAISNSTYHVQWKQQLSDPAWNDLTNITASGNSVSFTEKPTQPQRFYRVIQ